MSENIAVLLAHDNAVHMSGLRIILEKLAATVTEAATLSEVVRNMSGDNSPYIVFTDISLVDAQWIDVLKRAGRAPLFIGVIVVPRLANVHQYLEALEYGAFDLITPPLTETDVDHVLRSAAYHVQTRRRELDAVLSK